MVAIDGFNGFFNPTSNLKAPDKTPVPPLRVTIMQSLMKLTQADWVCSIIVENCAKVSDGTTQLIKEMVAYSYILGAFNK